MAVRRLRSEGKLPPNALDEPVDVDGAYQTTNTEGHTYLIRQLRYKVHRECALVDQEAAADQGQQFEPPPNRTNIDAVSVTAPTQTTTPIQISGVNFDVIPLEGTTPLTQIEHSVSD